MAHATKSDMSAAELAEDQAELNATFEITAKRPRILLLRRGSWSRQSIPCAVHPRPLCGRCKVELQFVLELLSSWRGRRWLPHRTLAGAQLSCKPRRAIRMAMSSPVPLQAQCASAIAATPETSADPLKKAEDQLEALRRQEVTKEDRAGEKEGETPSSFTSPSSMS